METDTVLPPLPSVEKTEKTKFGLQSLLRHIFPSISLPFPGRYNTKSQESQSVLYQEVIPGVVVNLSKSFGALGITHGIVMSNPMVKMPPYTFTAQSTLNNFALVGKYMSNGASQATIAGNLSPSLSFTGTAFATSEDLRHSLEVTFDGSDFSLSLEHMQGLISASYLQSLSKSFSIGGRVLQQIETGMSHYEVALRHSGADSITTLSVGNSGVEATFTRLIQERLLLSTEFSVDPSLQSNFRAGYMYAGQIARGSGRIDGQGVMDLTLEHIHGEGLIFCLYLKADIVKSHFFPGFGLKIGS
eukprot:TRINITY_DN524_c0_g5_i1.p1 TRINITY_DN524_c0_g5~~TRINITY_DN524_c0_g5_i1.p1  ORF type:complete len:302 (-),score=64.88 TRINITY_DN524_c0_g5_i1:281-1186(-)